MQRVKRVFRKSRLWISTEQGKCLSVAQLMPKEFESNRGRDITPRPQESDQLTKCPDSAAICMGACDQPGDELGKLFIVRPLVDHELTKSFFGDHRNVMVLRPGGRHIEARIRQTFFKNLEVFCGSEDDRTLTDFSPPPTNPASVSNSTPSSS
jgi:hypothetical protein